MPHLIELLKSRYMDACEKAVLALRNIIRNGPHFRDYCIELGIVEPLLKLVVPDTPLNCLSEVTRVILNLCHSKDPPLSKHIVQMLLPELGALIHHQETSILVDTIWALSNLTIGGNERIQLVIESGVGVPQRGVADTHIVHSQASPVPMLSHT